MTTVPRVYPGQQLTPPPGLVQVVRVRPLRHRGRSTTWLVRCVRACGHMVTSSLGNVPAVASRSCKRCDPGSVSRRRHRRLTLNGRPASLRALARHLGLTASALCQRLQRGWRPQDAISIGRISVGCVGCVGAGGAGGSDQRDRSHSRSP